jgi:hypothetical protein
MTRQRVVSASPNPGSMLGRLVLGTVLALIAALFLTGPSAAGAATPTKANLPAQPDFGPNVKIFDPSMKTSDIQEQVDAIRDEQIDDEMGTRRYSLLFKPGGVLHGGGRVGPEPDRCHHQRPRRCLQPVQA